ncbi:GspH/FimT family pseudopilin [Thioalkalivibrio versutus]|uniref:GspH/FimT family pseudopilin n=1 Tax=Thioalkalivibrio versutus TaxID=106634 RepID=UPI0009E3C83C|nr:GspH/FimT family pseudopilin [Thioalkalivibrio versutus]
MTRPHGFTLVELMVTLAVLAILASVAVPSFHALVQNNRATTLANQLTTAINLARSEAIRRGVVASVCSDDWEAGWRVELGAGCDADDGDVLRIWDAPHASSVIDSGGDDAVSFEPTGEKRIPLGTANPEATVFQVHAENCSGLRARTLNVAPGGRVGVERVNCP